MAEPALAEADLVTRNPNLELVSLEAFTAPADDPLCGPRPDSWWTGLRPESCPGFAGGVLRALPTPNLATCSRAEARAYFDNGWTITELLFSALQGEKTFVRPPWHRLRHPMMFYYCHPAALYINKLRVAGLVDDPLDIYFEQLFETGVDEMSWDDLSRGEMAWPAVAEVTAYRRRVYQLVTELIDTHPDLADGHRQITMDHPLWALFMGFEHERIHIETSSVLMRELPLGLLRRPDFWPPDHPATDAPAPANPFLDVPAGRARLGKPRDWPSFGWDNEYGARSVQVGAFAAQKHLVSNAEFHRFVAAGGYRDARYWTEDGWRWRSFRNAKWPSFWVADGPQGLHRFRLRTLFGTVPLPPAWPAVVNCHEARAYGAWLAAQDGRDQPYRLLAEAEHHLLRDRAHRQLRDPSVDPAMALDGHRIAASHNLALAFSSESPVDALPASSAGFHDVFGNVWQWCEDHFNPLDGASVHPFYDDFSTPCYDGEHQMMLGGSFASIGDEASLFARFHFRPHFHQHAGFRLAVSADGAALGPAARLDGGQQVYESDDGLDQYLGLHFGPAGEQMPWEFGPAAGTGFPAATAAMLAEGAGKLGVPLDRVLELGCAVGAAAFALARHCPDVTAIDLSERFIQAAERLKADGQLPYRLKAEGELGAPRVAEVPADIDRSRVTFRRADAQALPPEWQGFDAVLAANLIDRLPSPRAGLGRMGGPRGLVRPGGLLLVTSPYTWLTDFTPREAWLGGRDGQTGLDGLKAVLGGDFELVERRDLPLVIREHARKFQFVVAEATLWRRRA